MEYWKKINPDGTISTVESHSFPHIVPDAEKITKEEFDGFVASLPIVIIPENPDLTILNSYMADPHSGLPDLETAFQALARLYLGK